ncbi:MAG: gliding motility-associated C-terminal domain-containing protein [Bacteroidales bacterium]|nr:gliding motility-associated C-terminal domain-containing protein [Bacteroidales bacterium]
MKNIYLIILILSLISIRLSSQTYNISQYNGQTIPTCSGTFVSSGACTVGSTKTYCQGENYTITFYSGSDKRLSFSFTNTIIGTGDYLNIYDGPDLASPPIHKGPNTNLSYPVISSGSYITFHFYSDYDGYVAKGWTASISCINAPPAPTNCNENIPASNHCYDKPHICNLNGYCGNTSDYFTSDLPGSMCEQCDLFLGTMQNNSWMAFTADTTFAEFDVIVASCTRNMGIQIGFYSGNGCDNFNIISDPGYTSGSAGYNNANSTFRVRLPYGSAPALIKGSTYYIMVDGMGGDVCDYTIKAISGVFVVDAGDNKSICQGETTQLNAKGGSKYLWAPDPTLTGNTLFNPVVKPTVTTTYKVSITGGTSMCPLTAIDSVTVNVINYPEIKFTSDKNDLCPGESANIILSGAQNFTWQPSVTFIKPDGSSVKATPTQTTTYNIKGANTIGNKSCSVDTTLKINVSNLSVDLITFKDKLCFDDTVKLTAKVNNGLKPYKYNWSDSIQDIDEIIYKNKNTSNNIVNYKISLKVSDSLKCEISKDINLTLLPKIKININTDKTNLCPGESALINLSGAQTYTWQPSVTLNKPDGSSVNATPQQTTTYNIKGTYSAGSSDCSSDTILKINVSNLSSKLVSNKLKLCNSDSAIFQALPENGIKPYKFKWMNNTGNNEFIYHNDNNTDKVTTTKITLEVTDSINCKFTKDTVLSLLPVIKILASADSMCSNVCNGKIKLDVFDSNGEQDTYGNKCSYQWNDINNSISKDLEDLCYGNYTVTITDNNKCSKTHNVDIPLFELDTLYSVNPYPAEGYSPLKVDFVYKGKDKIKWDFGGDDTTSSASVTKTFKLKPGDSYSSTYLVKLIIDNGKCSDTIDINVEVRVTGEIKDIADILSSDRPFLITGRGIRSYDLIIFNRWGLKVFEQTNLSPVIYKAENEGLNTYDIWKGVNNNNKKVAAGVYFYILKPTTFENKILDTQTGTITVFR